MRPRSSAVWIVSRPHEVVGANIAIHLQSQRVFDKGSVNLTVEIVTGLHWQRYFVRLLVSVVVAVGPFQYWRHPRNIILGRHQLEAREAFQYSIKDKLHQ